MQTVKIACIGEFDESVIAHRAINKTFELLSRDNESIHAEHTWHSTKEITKELLRNYDAFWMVPASPYKDFQKALLTIQYARKNNKPLLGTCGGFQHIVLEYCLNVKNINNAAIEELEDGLNKLHVVNKLSCGLVEANEQLKPLSGTKIFEAYEGKSIIGHYHCNFALNEQLKEKIFDNNLIPSVKNSDGHVRGLELKDHKFFVGTLFQIEREVFVSNHISPLVTKFVYIAKNWAY